VTFGARIEEVVSVPSTTGPVNRGLRLAVSIADVAREMGHTSVARTYITYGQWADELGSRAANLRDTWAAERSAREKVE
jgi:hypothetical protein